VVVHKYYKPTTASVFISYINTNRYKEQSAEHVTKDDSHYTPTKHQDPLTPYELNPHKQRRKNLKSCEVSMLLHMLNYKFLFFLCSWIFMFMF